jgi:ubiquinone/menaquinone biosynthesis C-methylase UbiE
MSDWTKKRKIMQRYDLTADIYDMRYAEEQTAKIRVALENVGLSGHDLVLDAGCGTGLLFEHVAGKTKAVVGLDISRKTLLQARERARSFLNVYLIMADADYMPLCGNVFNHAFAMTLIQNTPNPVETLNEIERVAEICATIVVTGLKRIYALERFREVVSEAGLEIVALYEEGLQCYVAVCAKSFH